MSRHREYFDHSARSNHADLEAAVGVDPEVVSPVAAPKSPEARNRADMNATHGGVYRSYTAEQVLSGWRFKDANFDAEPEIDAGDPNKLSHPAWFTLERPGSPEPVDKADTALWMWLKVEKFFSSQSQWRPYRSALLHGIDGEVEDAFGVWYRARPLMVVLAGTGKKHSVPAPDMVPMPLTEAVDYWNSRSDNKNRQVTLYAARKAAAEGRLIAWRPKGEPIHTRPFLIGSYLDGEKKSGGKREGAGRKKAS